MTKKKNPAAVALGKLGGSVKGVAKGFATLSEEERKEKAREGARSRWGTKKKAVVAKKRSPLGTPKGTE